MLLALRSLWEAASTPIAGAESAAGADATTALLLTGPSETGSAADAGSILSLVASSDASLGTDGVTVVQLAAIGESSSGADASINVLLSGVAESSSGADASILVLLTGILDASHSTDAVSTVLLSGIGEAGAGTDAATILTIFVADASVATDNATASTGAPTGIAGADSATCADAATVVALIAAAEAGVGAELALIVAAIAYADAASLADLGAAAVPPVLVLVSVPRSNGEYGILITPGSTIQSFFEVSPDGLGAGTVQVPNTQLARFLRAVPGSQVVDPVQGELYRLANPFVPQVAGPFGGG